MLKKTGPATGCLERSVCAPGTTHFTLSQAPLGKTEIRSPLFRRFVMSSNWFDRWFRRKSSAKRASQRPRRGARLELRQLEDRLAPATWTGNGVLQDGLTPDPSWSNNANWNSGLPTDANAQLIFRATGVNDF